MDAARWLCSLFIRGRMLFSEILRGIAEGAADIEHWMSRSPIGVALSSTFAAGDHLGGLLRIGDTVVEDLEGRGDVAGKLAEGPLPLVGSISWRSPVPAVPGPV